jgi:hypothetical protein
MPEVKDVKVDLSKLKENIASQKKEMYTKQIAMGGNGNPVKGNKKAFLNELVASMHHGVKSNAIETIQKVNETVEMRNGVPQQVAKNIMSGSREYVPQNRNRQQVREQYNPNQPVQRTGASDWGMPGGNVSLPNQYGGGGGNPDGDRFDQEFSKANSEFDRRMMEFQSQNNPAMQKFIQTSPYAQRVQQEQIIVEHPEMLTEGGEKANLEQMVESALRGVVTNIYTKQKIQESLDEYLKSDDFINKVASAINIIAKRNKAKQAGK